MSNYAIRKPIQKYMPLQVGKNGDDKVEQSSKNVQDYVGGTYSPIEGSKLSSKDEEVTTIVVMYQVRKFP